MSQIIEDKEQTYDQDDVIEYARWLGIDPEEDQDLMYLAEEGIQAPLPEGWQMCSTEDGQVFFYNEEDDESTWDHPLDSAYKAEVQKKKKEKQQKKKKEFSQKQKRGKNKEEEEDNDDIETLQTQDEEEYNPDFPPDLPPRAQTPSIEAQMASSSSSSTHTAEPRSPHTPTKQSPSSFRESSHHPVMMASSLRNHSNHSQHASSLQHHPSQSQWQSQQLLNTPGTLSNISTITPESSPGNYYDSAWRTESNESGAQDPLFKEPGKLAPLLPSSSSSSDEKSIKNQESSSSSSSSALTSSFLEKQKEKRESMIKHAEQEEQESKRIRDDLYKRLEKERKNIEDKLEQDRQKKLKKVENEMKKKKAQMEESLKSHKSYLERQILDRKQELAQVEKQVSEIRSKMEHLESERESELSTMKSQIEEEVEERRKRLIEQAKHDASQSSEEERERLLQEIQEEVEQVRKEKLKEVDQERDQRIQEAQDSIRKVEQEYEKRMKDLENEVANKRQEHFKSMEEDIEKEKEAERQRRFDQLKEEINEERQRRRQEINAEISRIESDRVEQVEDLENEMESLRQQKLDEMRKKINEEITQEKHQKREKLEEEIQAERARQFQEIEQEIQRKREEHQEQKRPESVQTDYSLETVYESSRGSGKPQEDEELQTVKPNAQDQGIQDEAFVEYPIEMGEDHLRDGKPKVNFEEENQKDDQLFVEEFDADIEEPFSSLKERKRRSSMDNDEDKQDTPSIRKKDEERTRNSKLRGDRIKSKNEETKMDEDQSFSSEDSRQQYEDWKQKASIQIDGELKNIKKAQQYLSKEKSKIVKRQREIQEARKRWTEDMKREQNKRDQLKSSQPKTVSSSKEKLVDQIEQVEKRIRKLRKVKEILENQARTLNQDSRYFANSEKWIKLRSQQLEILKQKIENDQHNDLNILAKFININQGLQESPHLSPMTSPSKRKSSSSRKHSSSSDMVNVLCGIEEELSNIVKTMQNHGVRSTSIRDSIGYQPKTSITYPTTPMSPPSKENDPVTSRTNQFLYSSPAKVTPSSSSSPAPSAPDLLFSPNRKLSALESRWSRFLESMPMSPIHSNLAAFQQSLCRWAEERDFTRDILKQHSQWLREMTWNTRISRNLFST